MAMNADREAPKAPKKDILKFNLRENRENREKKSHLPYVI
jgi:hypothetical protein